MKKIMEKYLGIVMFYLVIVGGIFLIDARFTKLNETSNNNLIAYNK